MIYILALLHHRLQQGISGVGVKLDADLRRHIIREVVELFATGDGEEKNSSTFFDSYFSNSYRIVYWFYGTPPG